MDTSNVISIRLARAEDGLLHDLDHQFMGEVKAHEAREVAQADSLLDQVRHLADEAREILKNVKAAQPGTAVQAVRAALHALELQAKILGEIRAAQVNVGVAMGTQKPERVVIIVRHVDTGGKVLSETEREVPRETVYPRRRLA